MNGAPTLEATIDRVAGQTSTESNDILAVEEPLEIRMGLVRDGKLERRPVSITMRTPGHDLELSAGFLLSEGIIDRPDQIASIKHCGPHGNTVAVDLTSDTQVDLTKLERHFYTTSSCGVCGKRSIEALQTGAAAIPTHSFEITSDTLRDLPDRLRAAQEVFVATGGLHASALFTSEGDLDIIREDVGRHNALDKVIGAKFLAGELPLSNSILLVSGRASFELVQKALMAQIPILAAVGAPSSLAVELAGEFGMTLVGFLRDDRFNVYCGGDRIR